MVGGSRGRVPWFGLVRAGIGVGASRVGQVEHPLAVTFLGSDEFLVGEQLEDGVDRTGTWPPRTVAAFGKLVDHLIAVHRGLGEQGEKRRADVAAPDLRAATAAAGEETPSARAEARAGKARSG